MIIPSNCPIITMLCTNYLKKSAQTANYDNNSVPMFYPQYRYLKDLTVIMSLSYTLISLDVQCRPRPDLLLMQDFKLFLNHDFFNEIYQVTVPTVGSGKWEKVTAAWK